MEELVHYSLNKTRRVWTVGDVVDVDGAAAETRRIEPTYHRTDVGTLMVFES